MVIFQIKIISGRVLRKFAMSIYYCGIFAVTTLAKYQCYQENIRYIQWIMIMLLKKWWYFTFVIG